jgi:hypothetical protein
MEKYYKFFITFGRDILLFQLVVSKLSTRHFELKYRDEREVNVKTQ